MVYLSGVILECLKGPQMVAPQHTHRACEPPPPPLCVLYVAWGSGRGSSPGASQVRAAYLKRRGLCPTWGSHPEHSGQEPPTQINGLELPTNETYPSPGPSNQWQGSQVRTPGTSGWPPLWAPAGEDKGCTQVGMRRLKILKKKILPSSEIHLSPLGWVWVIIW